MAEIRDIEVDYILPPDTPARQESTAWGMDDLVRSILRIGLLQPVIVSDLGNGWFKLRAGMRRMIAHKELGKRTIKAVVKHLDEGDATDEMAAENFNRTQMSDAEEARFFTWYMQEKGCSAKAASEALNVPYHTILRAQHIFGGDPQMIDAFNEGRITAAQAAELANVTSPLLLQNMLNKAIHAQLPAKALRIWWEQVQMDGVDLSVAQVKQIMEQNPTINHANHMQCHFCAQWCDYTQASVYAVCHQDIDTLKEIYAGVVEIERQKQEEANNDAGRVDGAAELSHPPGQNPGGTIPDTEWLG